MKQVHDFRLLDGGERCSVITDAGDIRWVYVGEVPLTWAQWKELVQRVDEFTDRSDENE